MSFCNKQSTWKPRQFLNIWSTCNSMLVLNSEKQYHICILTLSWKITRTLCRWLISKVIWKFREIVALSYHINSSLIDKARVSKWISCSQSPVCSHSKPPLHEQRFRKSQPTSFNPKAICLLWLTPYSNSLRRNYLKMLSPLFCNTGDLRFCSRSDPEIYIWTFTSLPLCFLYMLKADNDTFRYKILQTERTKTPYINIFLPPPSYLWCQFKDLNFLKITRSF